VTAIRPQNTLAPNRHPGVGGVVLHVPEKGGHEGTSMTLLAWDRCRVSLLDRTIVDVSKSIFAVLRREMDGDGRGESGMLCMLALSVSRPRRPCLCNHEGLSHLW
jgi:hypothetical protein